MPGTSIETVVENRELILSRPERSIPPPVGAPPSHSDHQQPRAGAPRDRDAWHERHPVGVMLAMLLFGIAGVAVGALVIRCATIAVAFT